MWPTLDLRDLDGSFPRFAAVAAAAVVFRTNQSNTLARQYWTRLRAETPPVPPRPVPTDVVTGALLAASVISVKRAMTAGRPLELAGRNALVNTLGTVGNLVTSPATQMILESTEADPRTVGWRRVVRGGCDWCKALAGPILPASAPMARHRHCGCVPEPVLTSSASR